MHSTTEPLNEKALARYEAHRDLAADALQAAWQIKAGFGSTIKDAGKHPQIGRHWPRGAFPRSGRNERGIISERSFGTAEIRTLSPQSLNPWRVHSLPR